MILLYFIGILPQNVLYCKKIAVMTKKKITDITESLRNLLNIRHDCDVDATIANITQSTEFKGVTIWTLVFAIFLASIGLNVNSTAVIIGAMLVSPLMGPIMGIGLAIGITDLKMLKKSIKNLLIMTSISLLVSTIYFLISPLSDAQSELLARTRPTIFDVLIASFGGFAGIVAASRKKEITTVISGVAIATALMPPLCTAGYGIGTGQFNYFWGAFYLFFINSFFIALATFIIVKHLKFPEKEYLNEVRRRKVRHTITLFSVIVIIPSVFIAINVVREAAFNTATKKYITDIEKSELLPDVQIIKTDKNYETKTIELVFVGQQLSDAQMHYIHNHLSECGLDGTTLAIKQTSSNTFDVNNQPQLIQDLLNKKDAELAQNDSIIKSLNKKISNLEKQNKIDMSQFAKELQALNTNIIRFSFSEAEQFDLEQNTTKKIPTITIVWTKIPDAETIKQLTSWIQIRLQTEKIIVKNEEK